MPTDFPNFLSSLLDKKAVNVGEDPTTFEGLSDKWVGELRVPVDPKLVYWHHVFLDDEIAEEHDTARQELLEQKKSPFIIQGNPTLTYDELFDGFKRYSQSELPNNTAPAARYELLIDAMCRLTDMYWPNTLTNVDSKARSLTWKASDARGAVNNLASLLYQPKAEMNLCPSPDVARNTAELVSKYIIDARETALGRLSPTR